jgi:hypothetical protein
MSTQPFPIVGNVANVVVGPAQLFVAPVTVAIPGLSGNVADFAGFTEVGFTDTGIEWDYTPTFADIKVDELLGPVNKIFTMHKLIMNVKLAETTLANLNLAIGASTLTGTALTIGSPLQPPEFRVGFIGPGPNSTPTTPVVREAIIYRCVSIAALKAQYHRKDKVMYEVQLEALADTTQPQASDLCTIQDF